MQRKSKVEAPPRTGYQGTANRGSGAVSATSLGRGAIISRSATRGRPRGSGRGQERAQEDSFSFTAPNNDSGKPKRKRSLASAILNAPTVDHSKPIEHFKTPSMVRKAELAARSLADRVPDMQGVGLLSRPSDYNAGRPMRKRPQVLCEDSEMGQSNQSPVAPRDYASKSTPSAESDQKKAIQAGRESQIQGEITERTAQIDLYKTNTSNQMMVDADRRSRDLPEGVPTGPRALIQEQASNAVRQLETTDFDVTESIVQPLQPSNVENDAPAELQPALAPPENKPSQPSKSVTKINLKEYKSRRKSEFLGDAVPAQAIFGNNEATPMRIGFTDIDKIVRPSWVPMLSGLGVLNFNRSCVAQEFQTQLSFLRRQVHASGNIVTGADRVTILEEIAEWLRPCSGLIFIHDVFCILIFPARCEEWKFLDASTDIEHRLRYQIYEPNFSNRIAGQLDNAFTETIMSSLDLKRHYLDNLVDLTQNLQYQTLLPSHPEEQDVHNFYLFFPKKAAPSAKYIITWLRACNRDCRIYTNQKSGSWDMFTNNSIFKAGTIIIHEYLLPSISKISRLSSLINGNTNFSFWCMDDGSCANPFRLGFGSPETIPSCEASMVRLFPHGGAVFLTPSFLITQPERTYELLIWFQRKLSKSTPGTWKLVVPNECRQYLLDLAVEKASARDKLYTSSLPEQSWDDVDAVAASQCLSSQECKAMFQNYVILDQLLKKESMAGFPDYLEEDFPDDFESPVIYADESINQNDEKALVAWFAGWTMLHLNMFRKFIVVGTTPSKRRGNAPTTKSTAVGVELQQEPVAAIVQKPPAPQMTGPPAAAAKRRNRNAVSEVNNPSPPMPAAPPKAPMRSVASETSAAQNHKSIAQSGTAVMEISRDDANPRPASGRHQYMPKDSEAISRNSRQGSRTSHGIDESQPPSVLEFIAITGRDAETARLYLARYNGDVHTAVQRYWYSAGQSSSPQRVSQMDGADNLEDQSAVVDFIAGTHASAQVAERYLHLAQDDVRRAIALYNESQQYSRSPSGGPSNHERVDETEVRHENSPSRRIDNRAALAGSVHQRRQREGLQQEDSETLYNTETREARLSDRASLREIEKDLNINSAEYVRPDSTGLFKAPNKMNQVTSTMDSSSQVTNSRLLVKVAALSNEKIVRTLSGDFVEEPEDAYDPRSFIEETEKSIQDRQRAIEIELNNNSAGDVRSKSTKMLAVRDESGPEMDVLPSSDGADERQNEDGGRPPRMSGIVTNEVGTRQFVPRSVQPSGSTRPEISIRPGYMPPEDKPVYKNRRVVGGIPQYEIEEMGNSSGGSRSSSTVQSPAAEKRRQSTSDTGTPLSNISNISRLDPNFESTVEWYGKLRKNGQGWEHIYVGGWKSCFQKLLVKR
jgi:UBA-like domain/Mago binding